MRSAIRMALTRVPPLAAVAVFGCFACKSEVIRKRQVGGFSQISTSANNQGWGVTHGGPRQKGSFWTGNTSAAPSSGGDAHRSRRHSMQNAQPAGEPPGWVGGWSTPSLNGK